MVKVADYKDRIGQMLLYRNKVLTRLLEEEGKEFPNMNTIVEETERFVDIQDQIDNETISLLAKIEQDKVAKEDERKMKEDEEKLRKVVASEDAEDDEEEDDEEFRSELSEEYGGREDEEKNREQFHEAAKLEDQRDVEPVGDWLVAVLNYSNLNENQKNYLKILKDKGGFCQAIDVRSNLNMKKTTGQGVEDALEDHGVIKVMNLGDRKFVYLNHSVFSFVEVFQRKLDEVIEGVLEEKL